LTQTSGGRATRRGRLIRDPVYGYVELPDDLAPLVAHPLVQRLRRIAQTSLTSAVYPSATGTRFEHALGAMHLARRAFRATWANSPSTTSRLLELVRADVELPDEAPEDTLTDAVGAVALLHDVGHPPFSHALEDAFRAMAFDWLDLADEADRQEAPEVASVRDHVAKSQRAFHEGAGRVLLERILEDVRGATPAVIRDLVARIDDARPSGTDWAGALHSIVDGEVDVDRLDYVMRDARKAGTEFGDIDFERLIDNLELHTDGAGLHIAPGVRARSAAETLLIQRIQSYRWISFHPLVVGTNLALVRAVEQLRKGPLAGSTYELNYLAPDARQIEGRAPAGFVLPKDVSLALAAGVDDATVVQAVKSASVAARLRLATPAAEGVESLHRIRTYADNALFRTKSFVPAWKTVDEFGGVVREMVEGPTPLVEQVRAVFDELVATFADQADIVEWLTDQRAGHESYFEWGPVVATNRILRRLLIDRLAQRSLCGALGRSGEVFADGIWEVAHTAFQPIRTRRGVTTLYDGPDRIRLIDTSPLIRSLDRAEQHRVQFHAFFFVTHPEGLTGWQPARLGYARDELRGAFIDVFPEWLRGHWTGHLREWLEADPEGLLGDQDARRARRR
jgi:HD superfamily phosphohydrolase